MFSIEALNIRGLNSQESGQSLNSNCDMQQTDTFVLSHDSLFPSLIRQFKEMVAGVSLKDLEK